MKHILIVDDDSSFAATLGKSLTRKGFKVTTIETVANYYALGLKNLDYCILDLQLLKGTSLNLIGPIKQRFPESKILILTGFGTVTAAVQAVKLGADNLIHKPATVNQILDALGHEPNASAELPKEAPTLARHERDYIEYVLNKCDGNISQAARELGIHRQSLQKKLKSFPSRAKSDFYF